MFKITGRQFDSQPSLLHAGKDLVSARLTCELNNEAIVMTTAEFDSMPELSVFISQLESTLDTVKRTVKT